MNTLKNRRVGGQTSLRRSSMVIFTATLVGRVAGFARELAMAQYFGTSGAMDAWLMASVIPNLLFGAVNATLSATVVPVWVESERNGSVVNASQQPFLDKLTTLTVVVGGVLVGIGEVAAGPLLHLVAPGFDRASLSLATAMTRMMLPTLLFWSVAGIFSGVLQARERYALSALTPMAVNLVRIVTIVVLGHFLWGIRGVAIGFSVAVLLQLAVLWPGIRKVGRLPRWSLDWRDPRILALVKLAPPFFITSSVSSIALIVDRILASFLVTGSIAALNYAFVLVQMPIGLVVSAVTTPLYTRLAQHHAEEHDEAFWALALRGTRWILMAMIPLTVWLLFLGQTVVRLIYQHGAFDPGSTEMTAQALSILALGLLPSGLGFYWQRVLFAKHDTKSPMHYSLAAIGLNMVGDFVLISPLRLGGLALATALGWGLDAALLGHHVFLGFIRWTRRPCKGLWGLVLAGVVMALAVEILGSHPIWEARTLGWSVQLGQGTVTVVGSAATYATMLELVRFPEWIEARRWMVRRFRTRFGERRRLS